jgi:hypothetical protein
MANSPFHVVETRQFRALFMLGAGDDAETVENVDAELTLPDGSRWSATFMTLLEIERIMMHWSDTGENRGGIFFRCPDLVIVRSGGISGMVQALEAVFENGGPQGILEELS